MIENKSHIKIKVSSNKNFGIVFTIFFAILAFFPLVNGNGPNLIFCSISAIFLFFALFLPKILYWPNKIWNKFGMILGGIIAPIVMAFLFYLVVTPTGLIMKLLGKDLLNLKIYKAKKSYWIKREYPINSMKDQY